jgi:hypothetical protein
LAAKLQVKQDYGRERAGVSPRVLSRPEDIVERRRPIAHDDDLVRDAALLEGEECQFLIAGVVFNKQDHFVHGIDFDGRAGNAK